MEAQVFPESILKGVVTTWFPVFEMEKTLQKMAGQKCIKMPCPALTWLIKGDAGSYTNGGL